MGIPFCFVILAQYTIRPRLARLPDVGRGRGAGGLVREVSVVLDPARLVSHHIGAKEVADRILDANVVEATGRVDREYRQLSVIVSGLAATADAVGALVVRRDRDYPVRVSDLGTVRYGARRSVPARDGKWTTGGPDQRLPAAGGKYSPSRTCRHRHGRLAPP